MAGLEKAIEARLAAVAAEAAPLDAVAPTGVVELLDEFGRFDVLGPVDKLGLLDELGLLDKLGPVDELGLPDELRLPDELWPVDKPGPVDELGLPDELGPVDELGPPGAVVPADVVCGRLTFMLCGVVAAASVWAATVAGANAAPAATCDGEVEPLAPTAPADDAARVEGASDPSTRLE